MLFLLRKIRRKLMQKNKITTYLLYAIGEIILVVIGILIAVSINNWNKLQGEKDLYRKYLIGFKQDMESDIIQIDSVLEEHIMAISIINSVDSVFNDLMMPGQGIK